MTGQKNQDKYDFMRWLSREIPDASDRRRFLASSRLKNAKDLKKEAESVLRDAKTEFGAWKWDLCKKIHTESELAWGKDEEFKFILPPAITKMVYEAMIQEHISMAQCSKAEAASAVRQGFVEDVNRRLKNG